MKTSKAVEIIENSTPRFHYYGVESQIGISQLMHQIALYSTQIHKHGIGNGIGNELQKLAKNKELQIDEDRKVILLKPQTK